MKKFISDFILTSSTLIFVASVGLYVNGQQKRGALPGQTQIREIYKDDQGYPLYSLGTCSEDSDCLPAGCSQEICSTSFDLTTTCVIKDDFPDKNLYLCGCIEKSCVWYLKQN